MRYDDAGNVCQCDATVQIVSFDLSLNSFGADLAINDATELQRTRNRHLDR